MTGGSASGQGECPASPLYFLDTMYPRGQTAELQSLIVRLLSAMTRACDPVQWMEVSTGWLSWVAAPGINWNQDSGSVIVKFGCDYGEK